LEEWRTNKIVLKVAIAYVMQKAPYVFPVIGGRKVEHLMANLEALDITLTDDHIRELESVVELDLGFPAKYIVSSHYLTIQRIDIAA
jgi:aryl-alcohol dehydrogenase-like predicted oxidoreductase